MLQVLSVISKEKISAKPYILGKLLHGVLSAIYTYIFLYHFKFFNLDIAPVFANTAEKINNFNPWNIINIVILLFISISLIKKLYKSNSEAK